MQGVVGRVVTVQQQSDYYAFGLRHASTDFATNDNRYQLTGKESQKDFGFNYLDFHARQYDPTGIQFTSQDPLQDKYTSIGSYNYCANNPIRFIDPDGMGWKPIYNEDDDGNRTYTGYEWIDEDKSYDEDGNLYDGLYAQAIFFSDNGTFDASSKFNMGSSTATVYLESGKTTTFEANTNPSSSKYATVPEGEYHTIVGTHNGSASSYTALKIRDVNATSQTIELGGPNPAHTDRSYASGINIHKPGLNNLTGLTRAGSAISQGCLLIERDSWTTFINIFNSDSQRLNTVSIMVSRSLKTPVVKQK